MRTVNAHAIITSVAATASTFDGQWELHTQELSEALACAMSDAGFELDDNPLAPHSVWHVVQPAIVATLATCVLDEVRQEWFKPGAIAHMNDHEIKQCLDLKRKFRHIADEAASKLYVMDFG